MTANGKAGATAHTTTLDPVRLLDTQRAFDSVAADYDGPRGNNALIQRMRTTLWDTVATQLPVGSRLVDLGCGTGLDAHAFAQRGYRVLATDWSPQMVERTRARAQDPSLRGRLSVAHVGIQQLDLLDGEFDGMYSNFGPLNCAPDLPEVARHCARLLRRDGRLVFSVIGRLCPWELGHYLLRGRLRRAAVRAARGATAVGMNGHTIWTWYYFPREFYRAFAPHFALESYRALSLCLPPPYLVDHYQRHPRLGEALGRLDDRIGGWPLLRDMGDHFLIVLRKR
ncbi:class I SAM-dependent methyltransferase [Xanthomonas sacchari]|uniref:class I SAM-dependent methyltransferase n=1 Tax=Xanthomonas sacchari TaxID=56458 RepID=UPI00058226A8|nr:class I SAM-dependent methyltransferase [Xanthomonas sacchari]AJC47462.1 methyltransferase [Xanthomonas sacchari]